MAESLLHALHQLQGPPAYALVFGLLAGSGLGLPVNEDLLLIAAAALSLSGVMDPGPLIAVAWCGIVIADGLIFLWGRLFGSRMVEHPWLSRLLPPARLATTQAWMRRVGPWAIVAARFMPGVRSAVYFSAGTLRVPWRQQQLCDGLAAAVEIPLLVLAVRAVGGRWEDLVARWGWW